MTAQLASVAAVLAVAIALLTLAAVMRQAAQEPFEPPAGASNFTDIELTGSLLYSTDGADLYPLGNAGDRRVIEFGATGAISSTVVTLAAIATVTAYGSAVNDPTAAAQLCYAEAASGVVTFTVYNSAATPAAVQTPHAAGASYWIAGTAN